MRLIKKILLISYLGLVTYFVQPSQSHADELSQQTEVVDNFEESVQNLAKRKLISTSAPEIIKNQPEATAPVIVSNGAIKNPYELLVNLALKGKDAEGAKTYSEAATIYCKAARDGDANAQFALGWMYANGRGVSKDENFAAFLFTKAAEQGHVNAKKSLAGNANQPMGNNVLAIMPPCMLSYPLPKIAKKLDTYSSYTEYVEKKIEPQVAFYSKGPIFKLVNRLSPKYQIETDLVMAFIAVESGFNTQATSPKNAQGLMQLIPDTAKRFRVKDAYNPEDNIKGGMAYLQWLLAYFKGDIELVAAAYNSGELTVEKYKGVPPYPETQKYVKRINSLYKKSFHPYKENLVQASPMLIKLQQQSDTKRARLGM
ncbi:MAG: transglycosylase SLT domain-containing protein [Methylophilaceae bacterium]|nr:transglycosylase SLT domain-containing protein [Methylophilaceae bacterium]